MGTIPKGILKRADTDMTTGSVIRHLIVFSIPLLAGNLFQQLYNTVDSIVVGNFVGKSALAAVGSVAPIINALIGLFNGMSNGATVVVARHYGAHDEEQVSRSVHTFLSLTLILCVALTAIGLVFTPLMLRLMKTPDDVIGQSAAYLRIYFAGLSGLLLYNSGAGILRAVGDSKRPLFFLIVSAVTNTVLDILFVAVFRMGIDGAAIATILAQFLSAFLVVRELARCEGCYGLRFNKLRLHKTNLHSILALGVPSGIQLSITAFSNVFVQSYINRFGSACMAAYTSYQKIDSFALLPITSLAVAVTTFVGQNVGAGQKKRAEKGTLDAYLLTTGIVVVVLVPLMLLAPQLISLFNRDADVVKYGTAFIRIISPFYLAITINQLLAGTLRGYGDAKVPMFIMLGSFVVFRQIYLFITYRLFHSVTLTVLGYPFGWVLCSAILVIYYLAKRKKDLLM